MEAPHVTPEHTETNPAICLIELGAYFPSMGDFIWHSRSITPLWHTSNVNDRGEAGLTRGGRKGWAGYDHKTGYYWRYATTDSGTQKDCMRILRQFSSPRDSVPYLELGVIEEVDESPAPQTRALHC